MRDEQMKQLKILSHNTFWFQGFPFLTDKPPQPDLRVLRLLCATYREINPDVICLQEVQNKEAFEVVSDHLEMPGCYCQGNELPQYGGAVFWHPDLGRHIRNSNEVSATTQRMWQIIEVNGTDRGLRICNIHLPSQRQLTPVQATAQRIVELKESIRSCKMQPDIIVGDFNEQPAGSVGTCMESHGYVDAAVLSDCADVPTQIRDGRGDYIWINRKMNNRFLEYRCADKQHFACSDIGKEYLSDHLPLWITVEV